jgi:hypothetical protein
MFTYIHTQHTHMHTYVYIHTYIHTNIIQHIHIHTGWCSTCVFLKGKGAGSFLLRFEGLGPPFVHV